MYKYMCLHVHESRFKKYFINDENGKRGKEKEKKKEDIDMHIYIYIYIGVRVLVLIC